MGSLHEKSLLKNITRNTKRRFLANLQSSFFLLKNGRFNQIRKPVFVVKLCASRPFYIQSGSISRWAEAGSFAGRSKKMKQQLNMMTT